MGRNAGFSFSAGSRRSNDSITLPIQDTMNGLCFYGLTSVHCILYSCSCTSRCRSSKAKDWPKSDFEGCKVVTRIFVRLVHRNLCLFASLKGRGFNKLAKLRSRVLFKNTQNRCKPFHNVTRGSEVFRSRSSCAISHKVNHPSICD